MRIIHDYRMLAIVPVLGAIAVIMSTGCDGRGSDHDDLPPEGSEVFLIGPGPEHARWPAIVAGAHQAMKRYPYLQLRLLVPQPGSVTPTAELIDRAVAGGAKAIGLWVDERTDKDTSLAGPIRRGIVVVTMGQRLTRHPTISHVSVDVSGGAAQLGQRLDEIADGHISYVLLHANQRDPVATASYDRFLERARTHGSIRQLADRNMSGSDKAPQALIDEMLDIFPSAALVVTLDPDLWTSLRVGVRLPSTARLVALNAAPAMWPALRAGTTAALAGPLDGEIGAASVELIAAELATDEATATTRVIECELVTQSNLDDFARRYAEVAGIPLEDLPIRVPTSMPTTRPDGG